MKYTYEQLMHLHSSSFPKIFQEYGIPVNHSDSLTTSPIAIMVVMLMRIRELEKKLNDLHSPQ